ncbi:MAG: BamA/TamA family outer membrane protein [bacterium]|nr:BamA/TamA family outer membrane protein [bacterium]
MKKKYIQIFIIALLTVLTYLPAEEAAGKGTPDEKKEAKKEIKKNKNRIIAAPVVFYTPETSMAFGAGGGYIFRFRGHDPETTRPSAVAPSVIYTLKKQFRAQFSTELYFKNNSYRLNSYTKLEKFPFKFYGIGSDTLEEDEEVYTSKGVTFFFSLLKKLGRGFNIGLQYNLVDWEISETEEAGQLDSGFIAGSSGGTISGVGFVFNRDTRDHIYFPMRGDFFEFNARTHREFLGSTYEFTTLTLDLRKYFTVFSSHVLAVRTLIKSQTGTVPFIELARMGGEFVMRGYFDGRFRDKNLAVLEAEYRMPLSGRFGLVGFTGIGQVAPTLGELGFDNLKPSYGLGLRYLFDKKEKIRIRFDLAFGKGTSGFYFSVFEAF